MSRVSSDNPFEQIFNAMLSTVLAAAQEMAIGTVSSVTSSGIVLSLDGDTAGTKKYTCNRTERFSAGDRVLCARKSGTWVVICRIGNPGGPVAKTTAMTQAVGIDESGKLYTEPGEAYTLPTASSTQLGGVKPAAKTSAMTQDVGVDSAGKLYTTPPGAYDLPTASTTTLGGVKTSASYSASTHTVDIAVDSSGKLHAAAQAAGNVSRLYAGTSTTNYAELNSSKAFLPSGNGFDIGSITYPWQSLYFAKQGVSSYYLRAESGNIRPAATTTLTDYFNLGSSTYPFNALYVKKLYVNGKEITTNAAGDIVASTPDASQMWDGTVPEVTE